GEACANARPGAQIIAVSTAPRARFTSRRTASRGVGSCRMLNLRLQGADFALAAPSRQLFALHPTGGAEAKILHDEVMVVSLLAFSVGPGVGANLGLENELIPLARLFRDRFSETFERGEPNAADGLARVALLVLSRVVVADEAESCVARVAFRGEFRVFGKVTHSNKREAIHGDSLSVYYAPKEVLVAWQ